MISLIKTLSRGLLSVLTLLVLFANGAQAQNNAFFVSQSVPTTMVTGTVYNVSITMSNTGTTTWTTADSYSLGSQNPENNMTWGGRIALPQSIAPGAQATFAFQVTAPSTAGTYNFQWRMLREGVEWFGPYSPNVAITVSAPAPHNDAQVIGTSVPSTMTQGQSYSVAVTMKNTGNTTWPAGTTYNLGSTNPYDNTVWGLKRVGLNSAVGPGQQYTFSFSVVAPAAGSYTMGWGMVQEYVEWFGASSSSVVTVAAPAQSPTMSVTRTPSPMTAGQSYTLTWSSTNATSVSRVCTASGTGYTVNDAPALNGSTTGTASSAWVNYPSTCTWKATGAGGTATFTETMVTNAAPATEVVTYIHTDGLGSPIARTNASGQLVSRTRYEPYGLTAAGVTPTIGFTGHVNDADTGLVYMQQRYYDPVAGRMLSIDPVMTDANTGGSFNRYSYANNNPYKYLDPDGRNGVIVGMVTGGAVLMIGAWKYATDPQARAVINRIFAAAVIASSSSGNKTDGQRPTKTPNEGTPGSTHVNPGSGQEREYGDDGKPIRDVDHDHDHGQGVPHSHDWGRDANGRPVRGPGQPVDPKSTPKPDPKSEPKPDPKPERIPEPKP
jgi:RHS repeat-associated protein